MNHGLAIVCLRLFFIWRWFIRYVPFFRLTILLFFWLGKKFTASRFGQNLPASVSMRTKDGIVITGNISDTIVLLVWLTGEWEPALSKWMRSRLHPGSTFIDVGANIGTHSLSMAKTVGAAGRVVAIEAALDTYQELTHNVTTNKFLCIRCIHMAAGPADDSVTLYKGAAMNSGMASTVPPLDWVPSGPSDVVQSAPLHELLTKDEIQNARLIKIDIEGGESKLIPTLGSLFPALSDSLEFIVEIETRRYGPAQRSALVGPFLSAGYRMFHIESYWKRNTPRPVTLQWIEGLSGRDVDIIFTKHSDACVARREGRSCARD
ncbi:MAG: FkbM family methyltransferase [Gammaproteobacteria bacterium]